MNVPSAFSAADRPAGSYLPGPGAGDAVPRVPPQPLLHVNLACALQPCLQAAIYIADFRLRPRRNIFNSQPVLRRFDAFTLADSRGIDNMAATSLRF